MPKKFKNRQIVRRRSANRGSFSSAPRLLNTSLVVSHRFRFLADQAMVPATLTYQRMTQLMMVACDATHYVTLFTSSRLRKLECWSTPTNAFTPVTLQFEWADTTGIGNSSRRITDTSVGIDKVAHVLVNPVVGTSSSLVHNYDDATNWGFLTCPTGTVVDITVDLTVNDGGGVAVVLAAGLTQGTIYYVCLDGGGGHLRPQGVPAAF